MMLLRFLNTSHGDLHSPQVLRKTKLFVKIHRVWPAYVVVLGIWGPGSGELWSMDYSPETDVLHQCSLFSLSISLWKINLISFNEMVDLILWDFCLSYCGTENTGRRKTFQWLHRLLIPQDQRLFIIVSSIQSKQ